MISDWINRATFTVRRAKRGRIQQYPIQFEVGEAILEYLQHGRPRSSCRTLFLTLKPPYRPVRPATLWTGSQSELKRLGPDLTAPFGGHTLRRACATELLRKGSSLQEIADFLGHRDLQSVSIYARYDVRSLKKVAAFSLAGGADPSVLGSSRKIGASVAWRCSVMLAPTIRAIWFQLPPGRTSLLKADLPAAVALGRSLGGGNRLRG